MDHADITRLWGHLHWLIVLARQGSYTAAARQLGVSKAAMSQHIADLERAVGMPLVRRTTRSVQLTEAGQRLVDATGAPFEQIARSVAELRELSGMPQGMLRVTAPVAFARLQLVPRLGEFLRQYPGIRLEIDLSDRLSSLASEGFDLSIRHTDLPPDTHVAWTLCRTRSVLVAAPGYLARSGTPERPDDLRGHSCLHYPRGAGKRSWTFEALSRRAPRERLSVAVSGLLGINNSEALRDAARMELGIALLPDFSAQAGLDEGSLVEVMPAWRPVGAFAEQIYAIRPYQAQVPPAVSALVGYLRLTLGAGFPLRTVPPPADGA